MSIQSGIEAVRRFQVLFNDLAELATSLEGVQSLESLAKSFEGRAGEAKAQLEAAQAKLSEIDAHVSSMIDQASREAADKLAAATVEADRIVGKASADADAWMAKGAALMDQANAAAKAARDEAADAMLARDAARQELAELNAKIAAVKESARAILG